MEFLLGQSHGFIRSAGPLVNTVLHFLHNHAPAISVETDSFDGVALVAAEKEQCPFFHRIKTVFQPDNGNQSRNTAAQVGFPTFDNHTFETGGIPKHP